MAKSKKVKEEVVEAPKQEGEVDPYASGVSLPNPEPNNGKGEDEESDDLVSAEDNGSDPEQDEVAKGREEK